MEARSEDDFGSGQVTQSDPDDPSLWVPHPGQKVSRRFCLLPG